MDTYQFYFSSLQKKILCLIVVAFALFGLTACNTVSVRSDTAISPDSMWDEGKKTTEEGENLVTQGEKQMEKGRKLVRDGESMVIKGNKQAALKRGAYQATVSLMGSSSAPSQVKEEAKKLKSISGDWQDAVAEIKKGNKTISEGYVAIEKAQEKIREGREMMAAGSQMMQRSQNIIRQGLLEGAN